MNKLTKATQELLNDALYYLKMEELKKACDMLPLPDKGKKIDLINRIIMFVQTGKIIECSIIPNQSRASSYPTQPLSADALMLYGAYKNDAKTRAFFKNLIGYHFHFTAFGIDWLTDRWLKGEPPTYQEFANYWIEETERRKQTKSRPKEEWKYINFLQEMNKKNSLLSKSELMQQWKKIQAQKTYEVFKILESIRKTN